MLYRKVSRQLQLLKEMLLQGKVYAEREEIGSKTPFVTLTVLELSPFVSRRNKNSGELVVGAEDWLVYVGR